MTEEEMNEDVADRIVNSGRLNGRRFRRGQWLALLDGKVVAVEENLDKALEALRKVDPDPLRGMVFQFGERPTDVIR